MRFNERHVENTHCLVLRIKKALPIKAHHSIINCFITPNLSFYQRGLVCCDNHHPHHQNLSKPHSLSNILTLIPQWLEWIDKRSPVSPGKGRKIATQQESARNRIHLRAVPTSWITYYSEALFCSHFLSIHIFIVCYFFFTTSRITCKSSTRAIRRLL